MNENANLTLSDGELFIAMDKQMILTKRVIIDKTAQLFDSLIPALSQIFSKVLYNFETLQKSIPKITKGENYKDLPYIILDYPAVFEKENIFAIRTMFWWGNFISITLQVSGVYKEYFENNILKNIDSDFYICINKNQWQHNFEEDNYRLCNKLSKAEKKIVQENGFIKIALKYELHHWNMMQQLLSEGYYKVNDLLKESL
jgi:hypothetical protein